MNTKQKRTLRAIFDQPTRSTIRWKDALSLFESLGEAVEREGSRVAFVLPKTVGVYHKPHPSPFMSQPLVRDMRRQLIEEGVRPE